MSVLGVDLPADLGVDLSNLNSSWPLDVSTRGRSGKFELILTTRCQYQGVDLPADLWVVLPNLSFQTFRCGHHRGLFVLHAKDQWTLHLKIRTHFRFGSQYALHLKSWPSCSPHLKMWGGVYLNLNTSFENMKSWPSCSHNLMTAYMSSNGKHLKLPFRSTGRSLGGRSAKISFNNNIMYYTWQIWALIVEICNCPLEDVLGVSGGISAKFELILTTRCQYHGG